MRIFISQQRIDRWLEEGRVEVVGETLSVPALGRSFQLQPAVYFTRIVSDESDPNSLVGRVKTNQQLADLGAENYATSVIFGEAAYECQPGFIGLLAGAAPMDGDLAHLSE